MEELGGNDVTNFIKIYYATHICGTDLSQLKANNIEDSNVHIFLRTNFTDLRSESAYELFELYWPEAYKSWDPCNGDGLIFDTDRFLDSPSFSTEEVRLGDKAILLISPQ